MQLQVNDFELIWQGLSMTVLITVWTLVVSLPLGILLGVLRFLKIPYLSSMVGVVIDVIRSIPLVLYLVMVFLVLPMDAFMRAVLTLGSFNAMYIAEVVRGGLQSINVHEIQAAKVLGLNPVDVLRYVALPQALGRMIPSLVNQASVIIKDTTLVSMGVFELTKAIQILNMRHFEVTGLWMVVIGAIYFLLCYSICLVGQWLENRTDTKSALSRISLH